MARYAAESARIWLQPLSIEDHLDDYHLVMTNKKAMQWSVSKVPTNLDELREKIANYISNPEKPWVENYAILLRPLADREKEEPKMIDACGSYRNLPSGVVIGYGLHPDYWGKGLRN